MEREILHRLLRDMMLSRVFEERAAEEYTKGNIVGFLHLYPGEEAVGAGVINAAVPSDYIVSTYREHAHALVRGVPARRRHGRTVRSRHWNVAAAWAARCTCSIATGASWAAMRSSAKAARSQSASPIPWRCANLPEAVICFFGDGAVNQGTFHESLNMAGLWRLPVLFVCENNHYAIGTEIHRHSAVPEVYKRAAAYNIPAEKVDGMDVLKVYDATQARARSHPTRRRSAIHRMRNIPLSWAFDGRSGHLSSCGRGQSL